VDSGWQYMFPYTIFGKVKMFLVKNKFQYWNTDCAHLKNLKIFLKVSFPMTWKNSEQCDDRTWIISSNVSRHSRDRCSTHIQNHEVSTLMVTKLKFRHNVLVYWISSVMKFSDLTCLKIKLHKYVCTNAYDCSKVTLFCKIWMRSLFRLRKATGTKPGGSPIRKTWILLCRMYLLLNNIRHNDIKGATSQDEALVSNDKRDQSEGQHSITLSKIRIHSKVKIPLRPWILSQFFTHTHVNDKERAIILHILCTILGRMRTSH
jgi:hypothetical protein